VAYGILFSTFSEQEKARVLGVYLVAPLAAGGLGPILGGWLTESWEWRWVFFPERRVENYIFVFQAS
jgi:DHA2 family multidrug resistance protein